MSDLSAGKVDKPIELKVTSETINIARVRDAVQQAARRIGFSEDQNDAIALAIDEAVANVIRHGYDGREGQPIEVTIETVHREASVGIQVTICDCGRQVDPAVIVGRDLKDVRPGGLGTHIMRTVMDEVEYAYREPVGMKLRLAKMVGSNPSVGHATKDNAGEEADDAQG